MWNVWYNLCYTKINIGSKEVSDLDSYVGGKKYENVVSARLENAYLLFFRKSKQIRVKVPRWTIR